MTKARDVPGLSIDGTRWSSVKWLFNILAKRQREAARYIAKCSSVTYPATECAPYAPLCHSCPGPGQCESFHRGPGMADHNVQCSIAPPKGSTPCGSCRPSAGGVTRFSAPAYARPACTATTEISPGLHSNLGSTPARSIPSSSPSRLSYRPLMKDAGGGSGAMPCLALRLPVVKEDIDYETCADLPRWQFAIAA